MILLVTSFLFFVFCFFSVFVSYAFVDFSPVENTDPVRLTLLRFHSLRHVQSLPTHFNYDLSLICFAPFSGSEKRVISLYMVII